MTLFLPGPALDREVHRAVFQMPVTAHAVVRPYSTDESWARMVVKRMAGRGWSHRHAQRPDPKGRMLWKSRFARIRSGPDSNLFGAYEAESLAVSICVAALAALGGFSQART